MKRRLTAVIVGIFILAAIITFGKVFSVRTIEEVYAVSPTLVSEGEILDKSGIELGDNILNINETAVKAAISKLYPDNSVAVTDIERVFPNKVIIYVQERTPIMAIQSASEVGSYGIADIDFQLNRLVPAEETDLSKLMLVNGITVDKSYNYTSFRAIREVLSGFTAYVPDYVLPEIIESLDYTTDVITVNMRNGKTIKATSDAAAFSAALKNYFEIETI